MMMMKLRIITDTLTVDFAKVKKARREKASRRRSTSPRHLSWKLYPRHLLAKIDRLLQIYSAPQLAHRLRHRDQPGRHRHQRLWSPRRALNSNLRLSAPCGGSSAPVGVAAPHLTALAPSVRFAATRDIRLSSMCVRVQPRCPCL